MDKKRFLAKARARIRFLVVLLLATVSSAQTLPERIPAGTKLRVKLTTEVSTKSSRMGDAVEAKLLRPVVLRGQVVLPKGSYLSGRLVFVRSADRKEKIFAVLLLVPAINWFNGR